MRSQQRERAQFRHKEQLWRDYVPNENHPAFHLVKRLNSERQKALRQVLLSNRYALQEAALAMPHDTDTERQSRNWNLCRVEELMEHSSMFYKCSENTARVSACGTTIHQLSRELRQVALRGCISLDLKSAQLALAARFWDIQEVTAFLHEAQETGHSYWNELFTSLGLAREHKAALKTATYALIFGASFGNISQQLVHDLGLEKEKAKEVSHNFFAHPLVKAISQARERKKAEILAEGGTLDAFSRRITVSDNKSARSAMALQMQSYEVKLMCSVLPVLNETCGVYIVSWLHDGFTIKCSDKRNEDTVSRRLVTILEEEAKRMGVETNVDVEKL